MTDRKLIRKLGEKWRKLRRSTFCREGLVEILREEDIPFSVWRADLLYIVKPDNSPKKNRYYGYHDSYGSDVYHLEFRGRGLPKILKEQGLKCKLGEKGTPIKVKNWIKLPQDIYFSGRYVLTLDIAPAVFGRCKHIHERVITSNIDDSQRRFNKKSVLMVKDYFPETHNADDWTGKQEYLTDISYRMTVIRLAKCLESVAQFPNPKRALEILELLESTEKRIKYPFSFRPH